MPCGPACRDCQAIVETRWPDLNSADAFKDAKKMAKVKKMRAMKDGTVEKDFIPKSVGTATSVKVRWVDVERPVPVTEAQELLGKDPRTMGLHILVKPNARGEEQAPPCPPCLMPVPAAKR